MKVVSYGIWGKHMLIHSATGWREPRSPRTQGHVGGFMALERVGPSQTLLDQKQSFILSHWLLFWFIYRSAYSRLINALAIQEKLLGLLSDWIPGSWPSCKDGSAEGGGPDSCQSGFFLPFEDPRDLDAHAGLAWRSRTKIASWEGRCLSRPNWASY